MISKTVYGTFLYAIGAMLLCFILYIDRNFEAVGIYFFLLKLLLLVISIPPMVVGTELMFDENNKEKKNEKKKATLCKILGSIVYAVSAVGLFVSLLYPFASYVSVILLSMLSIGTMIGGCMVYEMED